MWVTNIVEYILNQANKKSQELKESWEKSLRELKIKNEQILIKRWWELKQFYNDKKKKAIDKAKSMAILEWKNKVLKIKHELLDTIFLWTTNKILSLPDNKYLDILVKLLSSINEKTWELISGKWESNILKEAVSLAKKSFTVSKQWDFKGWFILITPTSDYDYSLDNILNDIRKDKELEISSRLFKNLLAKI